MSPNYWGPHVWVFLHTLVIKLSDEGYLVLKDELYQMIYRILVLLPCPECSEHSLSYFRTIPYKYIKDKTTMCNVVYLLHNMVNAKLKKPLFNSARLVQYDNMNIILAYNNFVKVFTTTSVRLMNDNLHRRIFITKLQRWITTNIRYFLDKQPIVPSTYMVEPDVVTDFIPEHDIIPEPDVVTEPEIIIGKEIKKRGRKKKA